MKDNFMRMVRPILSAVFPSSAKQTDSHHSITYLVVVAIVSGGILFGMIFIGATAFNTQERTEKQSNAHLDELLDTVENAVSITCLFGDRHLALQVSQGLMKNKAVLGVEIRCNQTEMTKSYRDEVSPAALEKAQGYRRIRTVYSNLGGGEIAGEIVVYPDLETFSSVVNKEVRFVGLLLWFQLAALVVFVIAIMLRLIVRPIKRMSDRLHHMDATAGERLQDPKAYSGIEIGQLAGDINAMADKLVASLNEERETRQLLAIEEKKYHAIFNNAEIGIFIADPDGRLSSANPALLRLLGLAEETSVSDVRLSALAWCAPEQMLRLVTDCLEGNAIHGADLEFTPGEGDAVRWLNVALSSIGGGMVQGVVSDITERKLAEAAARRQAVTDPLTGVANRLGLEQQLQAAIDKELSAPDAGFALMLVGLDGFKRINEALGLPVGDRVLRAVVRRIQTCIKSGDGVARLGGDKFAIILPRVAEEETAERICDRIVRILARDYDEHDHPIQLSASIGVTMFPGDGMDIPALLRNAELALDRARIGGGDRYSFFDPGMAEAAERRRILETDMRLALQRGEFRLYYQPIIDIAKNHLAGVEALIRWHHVDNGLVMPDAFISAAEDSGLIVDIGLWGLETACRQLAAWQTEGIDFYMSLNVSGRQIPIGLSPQALSEAIARHGVDPGRLVLEITEGVLLADVARAQDWLSAIRELGFRFYLDDFGTGYSSLSYLKDFPISTVKVDQSFVRDMHRNASDYALVEAVVAMTRGLGMSAVAEGIETVEQLDLLRALGCRYGQGFYFSRAVPIEEFGEAVARIETMLSAKLQLA